MTLRTGPRWVLGDCWLGCEDKDVWVTWLGPVQWDGQHAPLMTCAPCLDRLKAQALAHFMTPQKASA